MRKTQSLRRDLNALDEREQWLRTEGVARHDAYRRDARGRPAAEVFARVRQRHARRVKSER